MNSAQAELDRLTQNQVVRHKKNKEILKGQYGVNLNDDRSYYNPKYFIKEKIVGADGKVNYKYKSDANIYWQERDKGEWKDAPRIFEDEC